MGNVAPRESHTATAQQCLLRVRGDAGTPGWVITTEGSLRTQDASTQHRESDSETSGPSEVLPDEGFHSLCLDRAG